MHWVPPAHCSTCLHALTPGDTVPLICSFQFSQMSRKTGISSSPLRLSTSNAAGGAAEKAAVIFRKHDVNQASIERLVFVWLRVRIHCEWCCGERGSTV